MTATTTSTFVTQVDRLVELGWPELAGLDDAAFRDRVAPLAPIAATTRVPYVLVLGRRLVDPHAAIARTVMGERAGFTSMEAAELLEFVPTEHVHVPDADAYLLLDVDPEPATLNLPPQDALPQILAAGRSPLTVEEGVAVIAQHPQLLREANCFSLAGSRCGDRRVPALWISARRPRLGWCWQGAPHTWLGTASCAGRVA